MNIEELSQLYKGGMSLRSIEKLTGYERKKVSNELKKNGVNVFKSYTLDPNYFSVIDTPNKAYFLGLLYADGSVPFDIKRNTVSISLKKEDSYLLEHFKKEINSNMPLIIHEYFPIKNTKYIAGSHYSLNITSPIFKKDCINLGVIPRKSLYLTFPREDQVPSYLLSHFIRGYFDGDGCVFFAKVYVRISIVGTYSFLNSMSGILHNNQIDTRIHKDNRGNSFYMNIGSRQSVHNFRDYIYDDADIKMIRKYKKFYTAGKK